MARRGKENAIDWDAIEDRTRSFIRRSRWESGADILRSVAKQFLNRPEIAALSQEMGGEAVPECVRRCGFGEAQARPQKAHLPLHDARVERLAARADDHVVIGGGGEQLGNVFWPVLSVPIHQDDVSILSSHDTNFNTSICCTYI